MRRRLKKFSLLLEKRNCFDPSVRGSRLCASQRVCDFEDVSCLIKSGVRVASGSLAECIKRVIHLIIQVEILTV